MKQTFLLSLPLALLFLFGCSGAKEAGNFKGMRAAQKAPGEAEKPAEVKQGGRGPEKAMPRKIIYTGLVDLIVDDFDSSESHLLQLIEEHQGYLANSEIFNQP